MVCLCILDNVVAQNTLVVIENMRTNTSDTIALPRNKKFAICRIPNQYENAIYDNTLPFRDTFSDSEISTYQDTLLYKQPIYTWTFDTVKIQDAYDFFWLSENALRSRRDTVFIAPSYEIVYNWVTIGQGWSYIRRYKEDKNCLSANPDDCICLTTIAEPEMKFNTARYHLISLPKMIVRSASGSDTTLIAWPSEYLTEIKVPDQYEIVGHRRQTEPAKVVIKPILLPNWIYPRLCVRSGYVTALREVLCSSDQNYTILEIQQALHGLGYRVRINGKMDRKTKKALRRFHARHG